MSRKSLIFCIVLLLTMVLGIVVAVMFLYSDERNEKVQVADDNRYLLFSVIPSDAVLLARFSSSSDVLPGYMGRIRPQESYAKFPFTVSFHDSGKLVPLFVYDAGVSSSIPSESVSALVAEARNQGYSVEYVDCSEHAPAGSRISRHSIVVFSDSEALVKSAVRHLDGAPTIMDAPRFVAASQASSGENLLFLSNSYASKSLPAVLAGSFSKYSGFASCLSDWLVFDVDASESGITLSGRAVSDAAPSDFVSVLRESVPAVSSVSEILPSYTIFAASYPLGEIETLVSAYEAYLDSRQALHRSKERQKTLGRKMGVLPYDFMSAIALEEIAVASFGIGGGIEKVLLMKTGTDELDLLFKGTDISSLKDYKPQVHSWPYTSFASSLFGSLFAVDDETCFTFIDGWIIAGSMAAVEEYVSGRALEYTLEEYFADASRSDLPARDKSSFISYLSFSENLSFIDKVFRKDFLKLLSPIYSDAEFAPAVLSVGMDKKDINIRFQLLELTMQKIKAPVFERDTVVTVPEGPFEVMNSGTGKKNLFYQNKHLSICLSESGRDLWGIPFNSPICGTAHNVDYYNNGKLQILFGAGSKVYLIDRLGRYVNGFPIDLGKEILLGPDVYDFSGAGKYNIMVLHRDNRIEMYNLSARKPAGWKGITAKETIKALPDRILVGGNTFWVVRTSIQTLIYPFYGGDPLTVFSGDDMILPDSEVRAVDSSSVEVESYDGKRRVLKLK